MKKSHSKPHHTRATEPDNGKRASEKCIYDVCPDLWLATPHTIAMVAATLARNIKDSPEALAKAALELFYASCERVVTADYYQEIKQRKMDLETKLGIAESNFYYFGERQYPVSLDDLIIEVLPRLKHRTGELAHIGKSFVRDILRGRNRTEPTLEEVSDAYRKWKPYENFQKANEAANRFMQWHRQYIREVRRVAGLAKSKKIKKKL